MSRWTVIKLAIVCALLSPLLVCLMLGQAFFGSIDRAHNMALGVDMTGNALFGGDPRMSISARTGNGVILGDRWAVILAPVIDSFFGSGHCMDAATILNHENLKVGMNYLLIPVGIIKYLVMAAFSLLFTVIAILFVNWWVVLKADANGNLPRWLSYFQTFDAPIPKGWKNGVAWLNRNPDYGFDLFFFGTKWNESDWTVRKFIPSPTADLFIATNSRGAFNFYYCGTRGTYKFGWKAWNNFTDGKFNSNFGGGGNIPICITLNPFKKKV